MDLELTQHPLITLFLSSLFFCIGVVSGCWLILSRRLVPLTASLCVFSVLFGFKFWLVIAAPGRSPTLALIIWLSDYLVAIPALLLLYQAGIFGRSRATRSVVSIICVALLFAAASNRSLISAHRLLNIMVACSAGALIWSEYRRCIGERKFPAEFFGLAVFLLLLIVENLAQLIGSRFAAGTGFLGFAAYVLILAWVVIKRQAHDAVSLIELQTEVRLARKMQQSLLPAQLPQSAFIRVEARFVPLSGVAGDFYDVLPLNDDRCGFFLADVSGHGLAAALIASMVKVAISAHRKNGGEPARLLTEVNRTLCGNTKGSFVTAAYVVCDPISRSLTFAAAGHPCAAPTVLGTIEQVERHIEQLDAELAVHLQQQAALLGLCEVPGAGVNAAEQIIAEIGLAKATFPTAGRLASWVGVCPGRQESAGVSLRDASPKGKTSALWLRLVPKAAILIPYSGASRRGWGVPRRFGRWLTDFYGCSGVS